MFVRILCVERNAAGRIVQTVARQVEFQAFPREDGKRGLNGLELADYLLDFPIVGSCLDWAVYAPGVVRGAQADDSLPAVGEDYPVHRAFRQFGQEAGAFLAQFLGSGLL